VAAWRNDWCQARCDNRRMFCPDAIAWGDFAAWVGALGAWFAAVGTTLTLAFGVYQWWKLRSNAAKEERIAQARHVYAVLDADNNRIVVGNSSSEPVYAVVVHYVYMDGHDPGSGEETEWRIGQVMQQPGQMGEAARNAARSPISQFRAVLQALPPGTYAVAKGQQMDSGGVEISFTDAADRHWVRRVTGALETRDRGAVDYFDIAGPVEYDKLALFA
jgi:hypothetical protein